MSYINSARANPIHDVNLGLGSEENKYNTLDADRTQGGFTITPYVQMFPRNNTVYLQYMSDSAEVPVMKLYNRSGLFLTQNAVLANEYHGVDDVYFYNVTLLLDSNYEDSCVYYELTQGSNKLTSEPFRADDLVNFKRIEYANYDRPESDIDKNMVDWISVDNADKKMDFYIECIDRTLNISDESEILSAYSQTIISATNRTGTVLECSAIPDYMVERLMVVSSMDWFAVNGIQYIKQGSIEQENFTGNLKEVSLNLLEKDTIGINSYDLGLELTDTEEYSMTTTINNASSDFDVEIPDGYMLHTIMGNRASGDQGQPVTVIAGLSFGSTNYIDTMNGEWEVDALTKRYPIHDHPNLTASSRLYIGISGSGAVLNFKINFIKNS